MCYKQAMSTSTHSPARILLGGEILTGLADTRLILFCRQGPQGDAELATERHIGFNEPVCAEDVGEEVRLVDVEIIDQ